MSGFLEIVIFGVEGTLFWSIMAVGLLFGFSLIFYGLKKQTKESNDKLSNLNSQLKSQYKRFNRNKEKALKEFKNFKTKKSQFLNENQTIPFEILPADFYKLISSVSDDLKSKGKKNSQDYLFECTKIKQFLDEKILSIKKIKEVIKKWDGGEWGGMNIQGHISITDSFNVEKRIKESIANNPQYSELKTIQAYNDYLSSDTKWVSINYKYRTDDNLILRLKKRNLSLEYLIDNFKNCITSYHYIIFLSLNYVLSILNDDSLKIKEIYISLDKLNIFNSNWENEILNKLQNIEDKLDDLNKNINEFSKEIVNSINNLSISISDSLNSFEGTLSNNIKETNSLQKWNNLYTAIGSYQTYKLNK